MKRPGRLAATLALAIGLGAPVPRLGAAPPSPAASVADPRTHDSVSRFGLMRGSSRDDQASELSGLAWDADEGILYAVSDRGLLHRFRLTVQDGTIIGVDLLSSTHLGALDTEGLAIRHAANRILGDTELLVVTEGKPQVLRMLPDGTVEGELPLPAALADRRGYRTGNRMVEAIAWHPQHGLLAAAESPASDGLHHVHAAGREWRFAAGSGRDSRVKALDTLPDGRLLILERSRPERGKGLVTRVRILALADCSEGNPCVTDTIGTFSSTDSSANYEGMTLIGDRQLLLVSDLSSRKGAAAGFLLMGLPP